MTTRIFQPMVLHPGIVIQLNEQASHHLARVLRATIRDPVIIFNGQGGEYEGVIKQIEKKQVTVEITQHVAREVESPLEIGLAQGISRGEKMDYIIQKSVELGVKKIIPLFTERCNVKLDHARGEKRQEHWQSIAVSACEQSGRNRIPDILLPQSIDTWLPTVQADYCFVLSPHVEKKLKEWTIPATAKVVLLIGPEGGLNAQEIDKACKQHFYALNLGPRILRTETAAVAALAALQGCFGDLGR